MKKVPINMVVLAHPAGDFSVINEKKTFMSFQDAARDILRRMENEGMGKAGASAKQRCGEHAISCFSPKQDVECLYGSADRVVIQRLHALANHLDQRGQIMDLYAVPHSERAVAAKVAPSDLLRAVIFWDEYRSWDAYRSSGDSKTFEQVLRELKLIAEAPAA